MGGILSCIVTENSNTQEIYKEMFNFTSNQKKQNQNKNPVTFNIQQIGKHQEAIQYQIFDQNEGSKNFHVSLSNENWYSHSEITLAEFQLINILSLKNGPETILDAEEVNSE